MEECCREEQWVTVTHTDNMYEVSTCGRVRSKFKGGKCLKQNDTSAGTGVYKGVRIKYHQGYKTRRVHQLVTEGFLVRDESMPFVLHRDGNRYNNHLTNLRYGSRADNIKDDARHGKIRDWAAIRKQAKNKPGTPVLVKDVNQPVASTINSGRKSGFGPKGTYKAWTENTEKRNGSYYGDMYVMYMGDKE